MEEKDRNFYNEAIQRDLCTHAESFEAHPDLRKFREDILLSIARNLKWDDDSLFEATYFQVRKKIDEFHYRQTTQQHLDNPEVSYERTQKLMDQLDSAYNLFSEARHPAHILDMSQQQRSLGGILPTLNGWIKAPTVDHEELRIRQSVIDELVANYAFNTELKSSLKGSGTLQRHLESITKPTEKENEATEYDDRALGECRKIMDAVKDKAEANNIKPNDLHERISKYLESLPGMKMPRSSISRLFALGAAKLSRISSDYLELEAGKRDEYFEKIEDLDEDLIYPLKSLLTLPETSKEVARLAKVLSDHPHPFFKKAGQEATKFAQELGDLNWKKLYRLYKKDGLSSVHKIINELNTFLQEMDKLCYLVDIIISDNYVRANFDPDQPAHYKQGWNINVAKSTKMSFSQKETPNQIPNDSPTQKGLTLFTGSNMSGKTYGMRQIMLMQMAAQSFGYAPAESGNFHFYDNIAFLDRASTDGANNLSAFGKEAELWSKLIAAIKEKPGKTIFFADEGFSTTSPEDQFKLLSAFAEFLEEQGVQTTLATHSDDFIDRISLIGTAGLYHFKISINERGKIQYLHQLTEGRDDSHAIEVARRIGIPERVLKTAQSYLEGEVTATEITPQLHKPITPYTPEQREALKQKVGSLRLFWPDRDEVIYDFSDRGQIAFKNRYSKDPNDRSRYIPEYKPELERNFHLLSQDSDLTSWGSINRRFNIDGYWELIVNPSSNPAEILERQQMFKELIEKGNHKDFDELLIRFRRLILAKVLANRYAENFDNFNLLLLKNLRHDLEMSWDYTDAAYFLALIDFNTLFGLNLNSDEQMLRDTLEELLQLEEELNKVRYHNSKEHRQQRKAIYQKKSEVASRTGLTIDAVEIAKKLEKTLRSKEINPASITEVARDEQTRLKFDNLVEAARNVHGLYRQSAQAAKIFGTLTEQSTPIGSFLEYLRSFDSVHMHQVSNYFEGMATTFTGPNITGRDILQDAIAKRPTSTEDNFSWHTEREERQELENYNLMYRELVVLRSIFQIAEILSESEFVPVQFNQTGDIHLVQPWSINHPKEEQVRNDVTIDRNEFIRLMTGANMSGKTFHMKQILWNILLAQSTGYASANSANLPIFSQIAYLDRVNTRSNTTLSAFGNEATYWKRIFEMSAEGRMLIIVDEAFSTTSPRYQAALGFAAKDDLIKRGQKVIIAGHCHEEIDAFASTYPDHSGLYHLGVTFDEEDNIDFTYMLEKGHSPSFALAVAKKVGMSPDVLQKATQLELHRTLKT